MNADEARSVVALLEKAVAAIWRAHGDAMVAQLVATGVEVPRPADEHWAECPTVEDAGF